MNKIKNIIIGWFRYLFKPQSKLAKKRLNICRQCPYLEVVLGQEICSYCGCVLEAKVEVEDEICYDGRWNNIKNVNENE